MSGRSQIVCQAGRMFFAVAICYALVLQSLFGSLAAASPQGADATAFLTVICHADADVQSDSSAPGKGIPAKQHCVLCQFGAAVAPILPTDPVATEAALERRAAIVAYARRQDPATAPLYLPPRLSRGPPLLG